MKPTAPLWIIDPSQHDEEKDGVRAVAEGWSGDIRLFRPALVEGEGLSPDDGYDAAGIVLMGSAASPHDDYPWLQRLSAWLSPVARGEVDVPALGICFGHQLIAHCAGGAVGFVTPDRTKLVCVEQTTLDASRLLPDVESLRVVVSHREEVKQAPADYRVCARRGPIAIDGLEHRTRPIFSFQFHPEAGDEFVRRVGISPDALDDRLAEDSRRLLGAFRARAAGGAP